MCVCVSLVKDRVFEETSSREFVVCAYAKIQCVPTPVCEGALLSVFVCVCAFGRAARRLLSLQVRRAERLPRHAKRLKWYSLPEVRSTPRKFVMLFYLSDSHMAGLSGRVFVLICCQRLNTHKHWLK